jgi:signal peptidase I
MSSPPEAPSPQPGSPPRGGFFRRLLSTAVLFFCLLLILRVWGVQPYEVPTGSMAPALCGRHRACDCPRCGYPVVVGRHRADKGDGRVASRWYRGAACPNCGRGDLALHDFPEAEGDRVLVNRSVFAFRRPRRWEMVVFHLFGITFVKRVIGLPGEWLLIHDGDVYAAEGSEDEPPRELHLCRKDLAELKALCIPVFDNNYQPRPGGWRERWEVWPAAAGSQPLVGTELHLNPGTDGRGWQVLTYRHYDLDAQKLQPIRNEYGYNGGDHGPREAVHDFLLECDVEVKQGEGRLLFGLTDGQDELVAELPVSATAPAEEQGARLCDAEPPLRLSAAAKSAQVYRTAPGFHLRPGRSYHVELAFADRRVTLAVDGACPFPPLDLPEPAQRAAVVRPARVGAKGVAAVVRNFRLARDIHYTQGPAGAAHNGVRGEVVPLGADQYFVLGDNSPHSEDSRFWPGRGAVPAQNLLGKPFLVHLPSRAVRRGDADGPWVRQMPAWDRVRWLR